MAGTRTTTRSPESPDGVLRLGTRRSRLALAQSGQVAERIRQLTGRPVELVEITTVGDLSREALTQIGGTGVFVSALRDALLAGRIDLAVHSLKDLPTASPSDLVLAAVPEREDPRDVLVARGGLTFERLPDGARVGTGSPRRMCQLAAWARELGHRVELVPIRGNIDTRLGYVSGGELDAVVLAAAGLTRLGRSDAVTEVLPTDRLLPAPGQGALAVECSAGNEELAAQLARLDDPATRLAVAAERALLAALEAGCSAPVGAIATGNLGQPGHSTGLFRIEAAVGAPDGSRLCRRSLTEAPPATPAEAAAIGRRLAERMLVEGVAQCLEGVAAR
ncbi:hydroxymethylbilane synthase [Kitasatospora sp. NPDC093102]|uniref:hydroxymethylbilane synthase n=1 Tax=Kitasatospora sp. NPDC093102 TaxID=3155069 RepID=UPI003432AB3E